MPGFINDVPGVCRKLLVWDKPCSAAVLTCLLMPKLLLSELKFWGKRGGQEVWVGGEGRRSGIRFTCPAFLVITH